ncbi:MAG: PhzF family phenazine biosynthesis protein [Verrucomicrobiales bacterium]|nr:PhzF family phenazine biosynthesis protein [Verrucomicrobiales bacterium]
MNTVPARNPVFGVDAFASEAFRGNPAAVCLLDREGDAAWMQKVAAEMNLSETAFLVPLGAVWGLRWFTPVVEVDLCGHATLASAHILWEQGLMDASQTVTFATQVSGRLTCRHVAGRISMDFPARALCAGEVPTGLYEALGAPGEVLGWAGRDLVVELASAEQVRSLRPDPSALARLPLRGVIVTAAGEVEGADFVSRFFAPGVGIAEDPVTGSAHCALAPVWAARLGREQLTGHQVSARGGEVGVRVNGDRVELRGQALTIWRGELLA